MKEKKENKIILTIGWVGTILIMLAYTLNAFSVIEAGGIIYPLINFFGAIFLGIRLYVAKIWANVFLEIFWGGIAIISIINFFYF